MASYLCFACEYVYSTFIQVKIGILTVSVSGVTLYNYRQEIRTVRRILEKEWGTALSESKVKKEQQIYYGGHYKHGVRLENFPEDYLSWLQCGLPYGKNTSEATYNTEKDYTVPIAYNTRDATME